LQGFGVLGRKGDMSLLIPQNGSCKGMIPVDNVKGEGKCSPPAPLTLNVNPQPELLYLESSSYKNHWYKNHW
jgi:hypothetical protein